LRRDRPGGAPPQPPRRPGAGDEEPAQPLPHPIVACPALATLRIIGPNGGDQQMFGAE
jgi:hypothetical protein